ncbi:MAG TPA: sortase [Bacilli bacterium]|nr:sortase [Bacilli bacterium]
MQLIKIKRNKEHKKLDKKSRLLLVVGFLLFIIGVGIYTGNIYYNHYLDMQDDKHVEDFLDNENNDDQEAIVNDDGEVQEVDNTPTATYDYIGVLEIPSIGVKRGFLNINDKNNVVNKNIQVIEKSDMPDIKNGNLIIAAHSGSGRVSYFKNLYKLATSDTAYIHYNGVKYTYSVVDRYEVEKTGEVVIKRNNDKTTLTLISCSQTDKTKQIVYILELVGQE